MSDKKKQTKPLHKVITKKEEKNGNTVLYFNKYTDLLTVLIITELDASYSKFKSFLSHFKTPEIHIQRTSINHHENSNLTYYEFSYKA